MKNVAKSSQQIGWDHMIGSALCIWLDPNIKDKYGWTPLKLAKNGDIPYDEKRDENTIRKGKKDVANYLTNITQK